MITIAIVRLIQVALAIGALIEFAQLVMWFVLAALNRQAIPDLTNVIVTIGITGVLAAVAYGLGEVNRSRGTGSQFHGSVSRASVRRRTWAYTVIAVVVLAAAGYNWYQTSQEAGLSDAQIKDRYCHVTDEYRPTDVYCSSPARYRADVQAGTVIPSH